MSDDLDKYLEDLGISPAEEQDEETLVPDAFEAEAELQAMPELIDPDSSPAAKAENFLVSLLLNFDPAYSVSVSEDEDGTVQADIAGGDPGKLIGRGGRTLTALEHVVGAVVNREGAEHVRVNIDVGGYRRRRDERLRQNAHRSADLVRKNGEEVELEPMSAAERRVVHMALADVPGVRTESAGEGRDRRVVIYPD